MNLEPATFSAAGLSILGKDFGRNVFSAPW